MNYANIVTGQITADLPKLLITAKGTTTNPNADQLYSEGWRTVIEVGKARDGFRITSYRAEEINEKECRLTVASEVSLADEAAAVVTDQKAQARALLDGSDSLGRLLVALVEQLVTLINVERKEHGRELITREQTVEILKTALQ